MQYTTYNIIDFPSGEVEVKLNIVNNIIYCRLYKDLNKSLMAAVIAIYKLKAIYNNIIAIIPFLPYSRSEIESIISIFRLSGVSKIVTIEIHSENVQEQIVDNISIIPEIITKIGIDLKELVIVAPDKGGYNRVKNAAEVLNCQFTWMSKTRKNNSIQHILHNKNIVHNRSVIIVDDIVDTGATINSAGDILYSYGAKSIKALAIHGVLSKSEFSNKIEKIYITNTIEQGVISEKIEVITIEKYLNILNF